MREAALLLLLMLLLVAAEAFDEATVVGTTGGFAVEAFVGTADVSNGDSVDDGDIFDILELEAVTVLLLLLPLL